MKKIFALLLAATLAVGTLASCGTTTTVDDENNQNEVVENAGDENKFCAVPTYEEFMEWASKVGITLDIEIKEYNKTYGIKTKGGE